MGHNKLTSLRVKLLMENVVSVRSTALTSAERRGQLRLTTNVVYFKYLPSLFNLLHRVEITGIDGRLSVLDQSMLEFPESRPRRLVRRPGGTPVSQNRVRKGGTRKEPETHSECCLYQKCSP
jgi:hypothetical protein